MAPINTALDNHTDEFALQQQSLQITQSLQTTLDIYSLIKRFAKELHSIIDYNSLEYSNKEIKQDICLGKPLGIKTKFEIKIDNEALGEIILTRDKQSSKDLIILDNAMKNIIYPLRNALKYQQALINSFTCAVTNLGNRAAFNDAFQREINLAQRHNTKLSLLFLDIDKFKNINDTYGHKTGDYILAHVAKLLIGICRNSDSIFRYGGEEFAILLSHTSNIGAINLAKRLNEKIAKSPFILEDKNINITASIGIANYQPNEDPFKFFERADQNMYIAKQNGRNQVYWSNYKK